MAVLTEVVLATGVAMGVNKVVLIAYDSGTFMGLFLLRPLNLKVKTLNWPTFQAPQALKSKGGYGLSSTSALLLGRLCRCM